MWSFSADWFNTSRGFIFSPPFDGIIPQTCGDSPERRAQYGNTRLDRVCRGASRSFDVSAAHGENGGSMPLVPTRALRFSTLPVAWEPSRHDRATKNRPYTTVFEVSTATCRSARRNSKPYDPVGTVNIARWQSGSEQRLTARTDGCAAGSLPSVTSRTEHRPIATATRRRATPYRPMRERSGSLPQLTLRAEKAGATLP